MSFKSADEFKHALESSLPDKIDIGAVFTISPKHYKEYNIIGPSGTSGGSNAFRPLERELVFDIDMDEYDDVRTCCKGAQVCQKCWTFIAAAVKCINETLEQTSASSTSCLCFRVDVVSIAGYVTKQPANFQTSNVPLWQNTCNSSQVLRATVCGHQRH